MAKNDNLKDFLTDVANAIRVKKGITGLINPQDFASEISTIQSGGGSGEVVAKSPKAVNFIDCDGTILHAYTKEEFLALTDFPNLPTREGLLCQGWNYTFADAVEYVTEYGILNIGASYITDDQKTRLYITIAAEGKKDVPLRFGQSIANGVTIDWGDGTETQTLSGVGNKNTTHHYESIGEYVITLEVAEGCELNFGSNSSSYNILGETAYAGRICSNMLKKVEIGKGVATIRQYSFKNCYSLSLIAMPIGITTIGQYAFADCYCLSSVALPKGLSTLDSYAFYNCYALVSILMPKGVIMAGSQYFASASALSLITLPQSLTTIPSDMFSKCYSLPSIVLPNGVTSISNYAFRYCYSLPSIVMPKGITKIGIEAFRYVYAIAFFDFSASEAVPTLNNTNAFSNISADCKIIVPDALFDEWIAATNWSTYASNIIKKSEWDVLNA